MSGKRIVYIVSDLDKALAFEWIASRFKSVYELHFILIGTRETAMETFLRSEQIDCTVISDDDASGYVRKWWKVLKELARIKPDVIHTHLWRANLLGLTAGWFLRVRKRVLTRHHAIVHYSEHPEGRKWDRVCNLLATDILAISENVRNILIQKDKAPADKIHLVHHGFDFAYFRNTDVARGRMIRRKVAIPDTAGPLVGIVARYTEWKGIQHVIPAFARLLKNFPNSHLVLANAHGDYKPTIDALLGTLPGGTYTEIAYETDLAALYRLFDLYVHVPIDKESEAFGQTYVEALAAGVPSIFTLSGVASEFVKDRYNALVVPYQDSDAIYLALTEILSNNELAKQLVANGRQSISSFELGIMIDRLREIYG